MKSIRYSIIGLLIISVLLVAGNSFAQFPWGAPGAGGGYRGGYSTPSPSRWIVGSTMMISELSTPQGFYLAEISDLVIDPVSGHVSNVVITRIRMMGTEHISIPFNTVSKTAEAIFIHWVPEGVYRFYGQAPYWSEGLYIDSKQPEPIGGYKVSKLMGGNARTSKGEDLGRIDDLVIDSTDGHGYLLVSHHSGTKEKRVAVSLTALSKRDENAFVLKTISADLEAAPAFAWSDIAKLQ